MDYGDQLKTVRVDFNARTAADQIRLNTEGSRASLRQAEARAGDWVWITDDEVRVRARLDLVDGTLLASPAWQTTEDVVA